LVKGDAAGKQRSSLTGKVRSTSNELLPATDEPSLRSLQLMDMERSGFTESQILGILKRLRSGETIVELCDQYRLSASTLYAWRTRHKRMSAEDEDVLHRDKKKSDAYEESSSG
jgi:hypothetical protein